MNWSEVTNLSKGLTKCRSLPGMPYYQQGYTPSSFVRHASYVLFWQSMTWWAEPIFTHGWGCSHDHQLADLWITAASSHPPLWQSPVSTNYFPPLLTLVGWHSFSSSFSSTRVVKIGFHRASAPKKSYFPDFSQSMFHFPTSKCAQWTRICLTIFINSVFHAVLSNLVFVKSLLFSF